MAQLPDGQHVIQQIAGEVILYEIGTEREIVRYPANDVDATAKAQKVIADSELTLEAKTFAHFWCGYFWANARSAKPSDFKLV